MSQYKVINHFVIKYHCIYIKPYFKFCRLNILQLVGYYFSLLVSYIQDVLHPRVILYHPKGDCRMLICLRLVEGVYRYQVLTKLMIILMYRFQMDPPTYLNFMKWWIYIFHFLLFLDNASSNSAILTPSQRRLKNVDLSQISGVTNLKSNSILDKKHTKIKLCYYAMLCFI